MFIPTQIRKIQDIDVPLMMLVDPAYPRSIMVQMIAVAYSIGPIP